MMSTRVACRESKHAYDTHKIHDHFEFQLLVFVAEGSQTLVVFVRQRRKAEIRASIVEFPNLHRMISVDIHERKELYDKAANFGHVPGDLGKGNELIRIYRMAAGMS